MARLRTPCFEVLLEQGVVGRGDGLVERFAGLLGALLQVGRNLAHGHVPPLVRETVRLHGHEIDDPHEAALLTDGQLEGDGFGGETLADVFERSLEARVVAVQAAHRDGHRQPDLLGHVPGALGVDLHPFVGGNQCRSG
jgi:hypothetical protein